MKPFATILVFLLICLAVAILLVLFYIRKIVIRFKRYLTGDYDDETFKRMADKHYRGNGEGPRFDKDYFKGAGNKRKGTAEPQRPRTTVVNHEGEDVTIIDERSTVERKKKIFTQDEGEYVEFTEEN
jgi:hypothetical protein